MTKAQSEADQSRKHLIATERMAIAVVDIVPDQSNRQITEDEDFRSLTESIQLLGVLQPLHVKRIDGGKYQLIDGERRWRAAQKAQLAEVPCDVWPETSNPERAQVAGIVLNEQRKAHSCIHISRRLREIKNQGALTIEQLATRTAISTDRLKSYLALFSASDTLLSFFEDDQVALRVALAFVRFEKASNEARTRALVARYREAPLSCQAIESLRKNINKKAGPIERETNLGLEKRVLSAFDRDPDLALAELKTALDSLGFQISKSAVSKEVSR